MEKCSVILADIDGTLIDKGQPMVPLTKQAIAEMHERGVLFGLATGRKINKSLFGRKEEWGFDFDFDVLIGMNGGQLYDRFHPEIESYYMLSRETMREILEKMAPLGLNPMIYEEDHMVAAYFDEMIHSSMKRNNTEVIITEGDTERLCVQDNYNVLFRFREERTDEVAAFAEKLSCERYRGTLTSPGIIEFMDPRVNKGMALRKFSERNSIPLSEILAFGDMDNDRELLLEAGTGVCLRNGSDVTKAAADDVTEYTCTEGGIGHYLYDHFLNDSRTSD